jgi:transketolase
MSPLWDRLKGFEVDLQVINGHDHHEIRAALANKNLKLRIIILRTVKGHGVSFMENRMDSHYLPLTEHQFQKANMEIDKV